MRAERDAGGGFALVILWKDEKLAMCDMSPFTAPNHRGVQSHRGLLLRRLAKGVRVQK